MFVSAGLELKVHPSSEDSAESHSVEHPSLRSKIIDVFLCNDNSYIAFLRENEKAQIFSAKDKSNMRFIYTINVSNIYAITFKHNTNNNIALRSNNGDVMMYNAKAKTVSNVCPKISDCIKTLVFTCDDQQLCGVDAGVLFVFPDINSHNTLNKYKQQSECSLLKCHPFIPNWTAIGFKNGRVGIWNVQNGVELFHIFAFSWPVSDITMSCYGNFLVTSRKDPKICGTDFNEGACNFPLQLEQKRAVTSVDLSKDDKFLAVRFKHGTLKLSDIKQHMKQMYYEMLQEISVNTIVFKSKAMKLKSNFSSIIELSEQEIQKQIEDIEMDSNIKSTVDNKCIRSNKVEVRKDESLEKIKKRLMNAIEAEMNGLKNQIYEEYVRLDKHFNYEFETIIDVIQKKLYSVICSVKSKRNLD
ncbi:hypothetical protein BDFB_009938 [Asbolus verrucosus]|uniref:Uncharacterized protein n=1 Tax=Asbolus verrucosus TaxID=1661398 RepID=A0A482VQZ9_ASBVE|nr:hypothetical protein BDFB_009938 [Asbolus verrucosus]